jgi:murein DD-endopeptidase MepM/ murein hydrolase activator NlpD
MREDERWLRYIETVQDIARGADNAVARRIVAAAVAQLSSGAREHLRRTLNAGNDPAETNTLARALRCDGDGPIHDPIGSDDAPLRFLDMYHEHVADDRRRNIFLDPSEAALAALFDFHSGRLNAVELRDPAGTYDTTELHRLAIERMRGVVPIVSINAALVENTQHIALLLRELATLIERDSSLQRFGVEQTVSSQRAGSRSCTTRTDSLGTRWRSEKILEKGWRQVERCCTKDPCCGNESCSERVLREWWEVAWEDTDSPFNPPPAGAPPIASFQPTPWNNRIPLFVNPAMGTWTSDFGWRYLSPANPRDFHGGVDIGAPVNTSVQSPVDGVIARIVNAGYQSRVYIRIGNDFYTFRHIVPATGLREGEMIGVGDVVGTIAPGGPAHLHYEINRPPGGDIDLIGDDNAVNPLP